MEHRSGLRTGETLPRGNSLLISSGFPARPRLPPPAPLSSLGAVESPVTPCLKRALSRVPTSEGGQGRGVGGDVGIQRRGLEGFLEEGALELRSQPGVVVCVSSCWNSA